MHVYADVLIGLELNDTEPDAMYEEGTEIEYCVVLLEPLPENISAPILFNQPFKDITTSKCM